MKSWCLSTPPSKQLWTSMMEFFLSGKTATAASSERTLLIFSSWWRRRKSGPWNGSGKNFVCQTFLSLKEKRERWVLVTWGIWGKTMPQMSFEQLRQSNSGKMVTDGWRKQMKRQDKKKTLILTFVEVFVVVTRKFLLLHPKNVHLFSWNWCQFCCTYFWNFS